MPGRDRNAPHLPRGRMMHRFSLVALLVVGAPLLVAQPPTTLPRITLEDQFGRGTDLSSLTGRPVIVLAADRDGFAAMARWAPRLRAAAPTNVRLVTMADLKSAPRLLRGVIRGGMPKDTALRVVLDWGGALARPIRAAGQPLVAAIYDARGAFVSAIPLSISGEDESTVTAVVRAATGP